MPGKGLRNNTSLQNNNIVLGLPYDGSNCLMIECTLIDEFHPVMIGVLETLNRSAMVESSMRCWAKVQLRSHIQPRCDGDRISHIRLRCDWDHIS